MDCSSKIESDTKQEIDVFNNLLMPVLSDKKLNYLYMRIHEFYCCLYKANENQPQKYADDLIFDRIQNNQFL